MMDDTVSVHSLRTMSSELALLSRPDGSAQLYHGNTSVLASVYGPTEVRIAKELADKATVEVVYKPKVGIPGVADKLTERLIRNTCESVIMSSLHPRTSINITVQEMQNSGSLLACSINAAYLALLDACVPLKYLVAAVCVMINKDDELIVDPTLKEIRLSKSVLTFAVDNRDMNVITTSTQGVFTKEQFQLSLAAAQNVAQKVFDFYKESLEKKLCKTRSVEVKPEVKPEI